jgi:hypothetical protein
MRSLRLGAIFGRERYLELILVAQGECVLNSSNIGKSVFNSNR